MHRPERMRGQATPACNTGGAYYQLVNFFIIIIIVFYGKNQLVIIIFLQKKTFMNDVKNEVVNGQILGGTSHIVRFWWLQTI